MLHVHHSNRLERLLDELATVTAAPPADPFAPEPVVVQNPGMARWLAQCLAERQGIAANLDFPLPASFFWSVLEAWFPDLPAEAPLDRESLLWRVMAVLPGLLDQPAFREPAGYLAGEPAEQKLLQLCRRVADLFDQYLVYRPDRVLAWEAGEEDHWQAALWRAVAADARGDHRAARLEDFGVAALSPPARPLPERVSLFGLTALPPAYLEMLSGVAAHTEVHLFLLNPSREYWADLVSERSRARRQARALREGTTDTSGLLDVGNPLLASLGHAGQEFLDLLLERDGEHHEHFVEPEGEGLLVRLQRDLLELRDGRSPDPGGRETVSAGDASIRVHVCHGRMREVQVLHDALLAMFDAIPGLTPRDVVVMAPDIDAYAPLVDAVFGAAEDHHQIPWSVSDRRVSAGQPALAAFLQLLALGRSRLAASEVLALIEVPAVQRRFGLTAAGLARIRGWVADSGIRWGLDGAMREALELPGEEANTWAFGLRRLFLGYALPPGEALWQGHAPCPDVEGGEAVWLGVLQELVGRLAHWRGELARPRPAAHWQASLNGLLADFLAPDEDEEPAVQALRDALDRLASGAAAAGLDRDLGIETVAAWLTDALAQTSPVSRFLTGRVTFCNMVPMRSLPFRVVCLIGLNDTDFPRDQRPAGFDLIAREPRRGDRSRRRDDRYLFLEALLSARDRLHLSYVGRDARDNGERVPSVLVSELLDYLERAYRPKGADSIRPLLRVEHPLQPFSPRCFDPGEPRLLSYAGHWLAAAQVETAAGEAPFADRLLDPPEGDDGVVELRDLMEWLVNPARWFLTRRLGLKLPQEAEVPEDVECFDLEALAGYGLRQSLLIGAVAEEGLDDLLPLLRAGGALPHGAVGELVLRETAESAEALAARVRPRLAAGGEAEELDLALGPLRVRGWLPPPGRDGPLRFRPAKLKAKDRLRAWVLHLGACALHPEEAVETVHVAQDKTLVLGSVADPGPLLADLLGAYARGQREPLPFFPETSLALAAEAGEPTGKVWAAWEGERNPGAESRDAAVAIAWRGRHPLQEADLAEVAATAERIWGPCLAASTLIDAKKDRP
jgi:exodeoxyribonuclease V gamma subunit